LLLRHYDKNKKIRDSKIVSEIEKSVFYLHKISYFYIFSKSFSRIFSNSKLFNDREVFTFYYSLLIDCSMLLHCNRITWNYITYHNVGALSCASVKQHVINGFENRRLW